MDHLENTTADLPGCSSTSSPTDKRPTRRCPRKAHSPPRRPRAVPAPGAARGPRQCRRRRRHPRAVCRATSVWSSSFGHEQRRFRSAARRLYQKNWCSPVRRYWRGVQSWAMGAVRHGQQRQADRGTSLPPRFRTCVTMWRNIAGGVSQLVVYSGFPSSFTLEPGHASISNHGGKIQPGECTLTSCPKRCLHNKYLLNNVQGASTVRPAIRALYVRHLGRCSEASANDPYAEPALAGRHKRGIGHNQGLLLALPDRDGAQPGASSASTAGPGRKEHLRRRKDQALPARFRQGDHRRHPPRAAH